MRIWKLLVMTAVAISLVVAALEIEVAADSHTKPKAEQATDGMKQTIPSQADAKSEKADKAKAAQQSGAAGHEGSHEGHHADHEGGHEEHMDEGSH